MFKLIRTALVIFTTVTATTFASAQESTEPHWLDEPYIPPPPQCGEIQSDFRYEHETTLSADISLNIDLPNEPIWAVYGAGGQRIIAETYGDGVHVFNASDGELLSVIPGMALTDRGKSERPLFGMLDRYLAVVSDDGHDVEVWDLETVEPVLQPGRFRRPQERATFSGDGARLALAETGRRGRIRVLDLADGQEILNQRAPIVRYEQSQTPIISIALNNSGDLLAAVSGRSGAVRTSLWDVDEEEALIVRASAARWIWFSAHEDRFNIMWDWSDLKSWTVDLERSAVNRPPYYGIDASWISISRESVVYRQGREPEAVLFVLNTDAPWDTSVQGVPAIAGSSHPFETRASGRYFRSMHGHHAGARFLFTQENDWVGLCDLETGLNLARIRLPLHWSDRAVLHPNGDRFITITQRGDSEAQITEVRFSARTMTEPEN